MLTQAYRLRKAAQFQRLYRHGKRVSSTHLRLFWQPNHLPESHMAVVVSKKITKHAVARNRMRRRVYEVLRMKHQKFTQSVNMIVLLQTDITTLEPKVLETELTSLVKKAGLLV